MTTTAKSNESTVRQAADDNAPSSTLRDGLIGGAVAILLTFLPLSTVLGGGVAGYLQANGTPTKAGALAGAIGFLPHTVAGAYLALAPDHILPGPTVGVSPTYLVVGLLGVGLIYAVGLGLLGGFLGGYVKREYRGN